MQATSVMTEPGHLSHLLRGDSAHLRTWTSDHPARRLGMCVAIIVLGAGLYGAAMGCWRSPLQAGFVALKFPIIILLTTVGNSLLNAMLGPLLGLNAGFRQCFFAILMSLAIASAILGSFSPLTAFLVWNAPPMSGNLSISGGTYSLILLTHVTIIAFAGVTANLRLLQLLRSLSGSAAVARRVLVAWLAGNLLLGSQLSWNLRPFIGSPALPVEFLRANAFHGNFFEAVLNALTRLLHSI
jgi:hypothetical protein